MAMDENAPLPFHSLIGHHDKGNWNDMAIAFATFYHQLSKGSSIAHAIEAMKAASGNDRFSVQSGSELQKSFREYMQKERMKEAIQRYIAEKYPATTQDVPPPAGVMPLNPPPLG